MYLREYTEFVNAVGLTFFIIGIIAFTLFAIDLMIRPPDIVTGSELIEFACLRAEGTFELVTPLNAERQSYICHL